MTEKQIDSVARRLRRFIFKFARESGSPLPAQKFDLKNFRPEARNIISSLEAVREKVS